MMKRIIFYIGSFFSLFITSFQTYYNYVRLLLWSGAVARKISVSEAINIVRFGSEKSQAGGMPIYKSFNNGKDAFISDSGLKQRLENLYTDDLLRTAVSKDR